ncbi:MAG: aldehyde dehydrogenase family protein, partial [Deltaproteobacteria bacterium]|nr:aldehyde dehydrogenase family protein [Deltaproteobacteria bacterium]
MSVQMLRAVSPTTGQVLSEHQAHDGAAVEERLAAARSAFLRHRRSPLPDRAELLRSVAEELRRRRDDLA